jgi:ubiquitin carboxyl-terminal hydrolase L5
MMNQKEVEIGNELQHFKESTKDLSTVLRGYQLDRNVFIRKTHNAFARRMDFLNSDLYLENDASASKSKKRSKASRKKKTSKKRGDTDYGFHFIAYVPSDGQVWELDGLRSRPHKLGEMSPSNIARLFNF